VPVVFLYLRICVLHRYHVPACFHTACVQLLLKCVQAAATAIQSCWRGFLARQTLAENRRELAMFMRMVRQRKKREAHEASGIGMKVARFFLGKAKSLL
jgi:hypothetical protein